MEEAESAPNEYDQYYEFSPLGILADSYFSHLDSGAQYGYQQTEDLGQVGLGTTDWRRAEYTAVSRQPYQSQNPMDLNLLSAENYQEGAYDQPSSRQDRRPEILYGGIVASSSHEAPTPDPQGNTSSRRSPRKDTSKNASTEEDIPRPRGRPRLDTRDRTAAERRRTQIRLAQRAYRQRKETTISGLNRRVTHLEKTIEDMHNTFLAFSDRAIGSGVQENNPALAEHLKITADCLTDLAKNSVLDSNAEEDDLDQFSEAETARTERTQSKPRQIHHTSQPDRVPAPEYRSIFDEGADNDDGETAQQAPVSQAQFEDISFSDWTSTEAMQHYPLEVPAKCNTISGIVEEQEKRSIPGPNVHYVQNFDTNDTMQDQVQIPQTRTTQDPLPFGYVPSPSEHRNVNHVPSSGNLSDLLSLPIPKSYASHESSFTRRLLRSGLEEAYRIMTNPTSRPEDTERICRFTRCFATNPRIKSHIRALIERSATESLEFWSFPARHVGGAGLHYPRVGSDTHGLPPDGWAADVATGPLPPFHAETPMPPWMTTRQIMERVGVDGEWFDPNDVEQYLRSKGLYLDAQSSIVELKEDEMVPALTETQGPSPSSLDASSPRHSTGGPCSPADADMDLPDDYLLQNTDSLWNDFATNTPTFPDLTKDMPLNGTSSWDPNAFIPNADSVVFSDSMPNFNTKMKKFVDVDKFVRIILKTGVCIGRTPGFRRPAVESALLLATF